MKKRLTHISASTGHRKSLSVQPNNCPVEKSHVMQTPLGALSGILLSDPELLPGLKAWALAGRDLLIASRLADSPRDNNGGPSCTR